MKNHVLVIALLAATLASGSLYSAVSAPLEGFGPAMAAENPGDCDSDGRGMAGERHFARMVEILDLSDEQQKQIKAIRESEWEKAAPLRKALAENRQHLHEAIQAESFDEAAVRALAAGQTQTRTELIVSRARMQSRINAVLTPEQRALAEKLRPLLRKPLGPRDRQREKGEGGPRY